MKELKLLSWNVNGIRAAYGKGFLDWFLKEQPDILCLQETKAYEEQLPPELQQVEGYHAYFSSAEKKGYSGVALYTRTEPQRLVRGFGSERFDNEGRTIIADYGPFVLFDIYFPNGQMSSERLTYKMDFYDAFLDYLEGVRKQGKHIIVCGDVNTAHKEIDLARPKANENISGFLPTERAWVDRFISHGYVDTFRMFNQEPAQYTWWNMRSAARERNVGWRLDYFFVDQEFKENVKSASIYPEVMGSDHCPVGITVVLPD